MMYLCGAIRVYGVVELIRVQGISQAMKVVLFSLIIILLLVLAINFLQVDGMDKQNDCKGERITTLNGY